ncbi:unnamed protein product [Miscanthus lutarioriparius]|uniref:Uncharacterized protein n=1 Tax=Miscanthus lutarioriparius TaxID=422564 RepID=A0A811P7W2_9POAL|nr:unnamed protein product [Miscanthus lutarioriparius]
MAAVDDYDDEDTLALFDFHESRAGELQKKSPVCGVCGLVESGVTTAVALVGAAARSCGFFQVTNHGIPVGTVESALSAVRAFNEQPLAARSAYYSVSIAGPAVYTTVPIPPRNAGQHANVPLLPWRDTLVLRFGHDKSHLNHLPAACLDALLEYHQSLTALGKVIAGLLSEALSVGSEQLDRAVQVEATHAVPLLPAVPSARAGCRQPCPHRGDFFTVVAQDGVGGLQVRLDSHGDAWVDVVPVTGALLINIGEVLKVL